MANPILACGILVAVLTAYGYLHDRFGWPATAGVMLAFVAFATAFALRNWSKREKKRWHLDGGISEELQMRLTAHSHPDEIGPLSELDDVPFEPIIIERYYSMSSTGAIFLLGFMLVITIQIAIGLLLHIDLFKVGGAVVFPIALTFIWFVARLRPTYYRIVPGRMDVLISSALSRKSRILLRVDLRQTKITARFNERKIEFEPLGATAITIGLFTLAEPFRFVNAVFQAAICTTPAPPLPDDELLG